ncbi:peptide ABC transporter [Brevibacillus panacihumi W25]|uniref:Peptide ABC transporter n=1 Tax=Brevibacillus panacihumi W25 TaxID=1408254 RepID=V6LZH2_9BACL|nr:ABC transporter permease [Brevibacillus panacihumi]EST51532.1 peptide ABC transporter [Brevibacillus panacihumi W25]
MNLYLVKRILALIPVLFVVSVVIFLIIHITPGDPASVILGESATAQDVEALRQQLGLDLPMYQQYMNWILDVLRGDLGESYFMKESVSEAIFSHLQPTLSLAILAQIIALLIAIPLGITAALRRGTAADQTVMGFSLLGMAIPSFLLALFLILLVGVKLQWLPVAGYKPLEAGLWTHLKYLILPAVSLGAIQSALITRMTRSSMLEVLNMNYMKAARSKGVKDRQLIYKHALRNAFLPILTVIGQTFGGLVTGAVVTETIFNIPGIGQLIINSVERRDYEVIQGVVLFVTCAYVFINLIVDILYGVIDPRVRLERK